LHDLEVKYSKILSVIGKSDDVKINLSLPESDYNCFIDELNLRNIFDNMLGNSCRFTKEGSIDISYFYDGRFHFTISDTGPGINLYDQHFMFMPGREFKGYPRSAGLGMYIIHKIIENMNGKISFESEEGMGTTFFIDIQAPCKEVR
jgi:signal transduction histidine kinase